MIPKIIHYCWFGGNPLPELALKCIESWKKFCPDYEIKEWNESNFDVNCCSYVKEAYQAKKWAFVSDYARFWILYREGGLYFDTDVEIIASLEDIIAKGNFMACEQVMSAAFGINAAPGLGLAANPGLGLYKEILEFYEKKHFFREDGGLDVTTVVQYTTDILVQHGFHPRNEIAYIDEIYIYPPEYFCPMNYATGELKITPNTRTIHHYSESWHNKSEKIVTEINRFFKRKGKSGSFLENMITAPFRLWNRIRLYGFLNTLKYIFKRK